MKNVSLRNMHGASIQIAQFKNNVPLQTLSKGTRRTDMVTKSREITSLTENKHNRRSIIPAADNGSNGAPASAPSSAETARTIVDLVAHGTLCTSNDDGLPLGTYVTYVLDSEGQPILRLRADAVHTRNLQRESKCSLFVQPGEHPARLLARVTLMGSVEPVDAEVAAQAAALHQQMHQGGVGVDAPENTDLYYRLVVNKCFYVGGLSGASSAESITAEDYKSAEPDPLRTIASSLVNFWNSERPEDVLRIAANQTAAAFDDLASAELLWVDKLGAYVKAAEAGKPAAETVRVSFLRQVEDERDLRSTLTMLAQVAWEADRTYQPVFSPPPPPPAVESN